MSTPTIPSTPELTLFFDKSRCDTDWQQYLLLLYSPLGLVLCVIRLFIALHMYLIAALLSRLNTLRNFVLESMLLVLGVRIRKDTSKARPSGESKVFISNHVSKFDFIPFHIALNCSTPNTASCAFPYGGESLGLINFGRNTRFSRSTFLSKLKSYLSANEAPIVLFPEEETTSGKKGLLKFSCWPVSACNCVQPVVLSAHRPLSHVSLSPIPSASWYSDLFWFLFTPCTVFTIRFLPVMTRTSAESDEAFMERIESCIAREANLSTSTFTSNDKYELEKRLKREMLLAARRSESSGGARRYESRLYGEADRIKQVLPHVPLNMIVRELARSHGNAEVTIARLLDTYQSPNSSTGSINMSSSFSNQTSTGSSPAVSSSPQFNASPKNRMSAFAERKVKFIADARAKYLEKHGLNVKS